MLRTLASNRKDSADPTGGQLVSLADMIDKYELATNQMKPKWSILLRAVGISDPGTKEEVDNLEGFDM